jgi:hypothetical protein
LILGDEMPLFNEKKLIESIVVPDLSKFNLTINPNAAAFIRGNSLASQPGVRLIPVNNLALPNPSTTVIPKDVLPEQKIDWLASALAKPKENYAALTSQSPLFETTINPFSTENFSVISRSDSNPLADFSAAIRSEATLISKTKTKLQEIVHSLQEMKVNKLTFPQCYRKISHLISQAPKEGISLLAVVFEIYRANYLQALVELQDRKSPMQVAIESEDIDAINEILLEEPKRENYIIRYKNGEYSEIEFAIFLGKVTVVQNFLKAKGLNDVINLGEFQDNPLQRAQERCDVLTNANPAFREAEDYLDINIPLASEKNVQRLLRNLIKTLPTDKETVNGLFLTDEYAVIKVLIAEKETVLREKNRWMNAIHRFRKNRMGESISKKNEVDRSVLQIAEGDPMAKSIFKHATANYDAIKESNQLETVQTVLSTKVSAVGTPIGSRSNIYFSHNSPTTAITPLCGKVNHIIELDIVKAIQDKNFLRSQDIYTSPHLPAFKVNRSEVPIIFSGEDSSKKTIYRVSHNTKQDTVTNKKIFYKQYTFDYYDNNKGLISSYNEEYLIEEEFFCGDNVKFTAYRLMDFLRKIKGPFTEGSYYHYVLANAKNLTVLDAARAAIFNVLNIEGKITKNIRLDHPAITITENSTAVHHEALSNDATQAINNLIESNELVKLQEAINNFSIYKEQLSFALEKAIECQHSTIVKGLLDIGIPISALNNTALLNKAFTALEKSYFKYNKNLKEAEVKKAIEILGFIFYRGSADNEDPKHIRYAASIDSFLASTSTHDLRSLISLIIFFVDCSKSLWNILLVNTASQRLVPLYNMTAHFALIEMHERVAKRLNRMSFFNRPDAKDLLVAIENNDSSKLLQCLNAATGNQVHYCVLCHVSLSYAIQLERNDIIRTLYPNKIQSFPCGLSPFIFAIRIGRVSTVRLFLELGANPDEKNIFNNSAIEYAKYLNSAELLPYLYYKSKIHGLKPALLAAIADKQIAALQLILDEQKTNLKSPIFEELLPEIIYAAVETNNKEIIELMLPDYLEHAVNIHDILKLVIKKNLLTSFDFLLIGIIKQDRTLKIPSLYLLSDSILFLAAETGSREALAIVNRYLTQLSPAQRREIKYINSSGYNLLQAAIFNVNFNNLTLIKEIIPNLTYFSKSFPDQLALFKEAMVYNKIEIIEKLIEEGINLPQSENEKINLLANCVLYGSTDSIKWLFNRKLFNKESVFGSNKQNCLQAIFQFFVDNKVILSKKVTTENIAKSIQYLVDEMNISVNDKDAQGESILFYKTKYNLCALEIIRAILMLELTDLSIKDPENNNTVLHSLPHCLITPDLLDRYVHKGGNINDENNAKKTPLTHFLLPSVYKKSEDSMRTVKKNGIPDFNICSKYPEGSIDKFIQLGAKAANYILADPYSLGIVTYIYNKELYLLTHGKNLLLFQIGDMSDAYQNKCIYFRPKITSENSVFNLYSYNAGNSSRLLDVNQLYSFSDISIDNNEYSWVKYPSQFSNDGKSVSNGIQTFAVEPMKTILEKVYCLFQNQQLGGCESILSDDEYALITKGILKALDKRNAVNANIFSKNLNELPEAINNYKTLEIEIPTKIFSLIDLPDHRPDYRESIVCSPLTLSVLLGQIDTAKYLVNNGFLYNVLDSRYTYLIFLAIEHQDFSFFSSLLHIPLMQSLFSSHPKIGLDYLSYLVAYIIGDMDDKNIRLTQQQLVTTLVNCVKDFTKKDTKKFKTSLYKLFEKLEKTSNGINLDGVKKMFDELTTHQIALVNDEPEVINSEPPHKKQKLSNDKEKNDKPVDRKGKSKLRNSDEDAKTKPNKQRKLTENESDTETDDINHEIIVAATQSNSSQGQTSRTSIANSSIPGTFFHHVSSNNNSLNQSNENQIIKNAMRSRLLRINFIP